MCEVCYATAGKPYVDTPNVRAAVDLMRRAERDNYDNDLGNGIYLVTGNWNIGDDDIRWCLNPDNADPSALERELCELLLTMSLDERHTAMAIETRLVGHP